VRIHGPQEGDTIVMEWGALVDPPGAGNPCLAWRLAVTLAEDPGDV
jgi:hypothetical protein